MSPHLIEIMAWRFDFTTGVAYVGERTFKLYDIDGQLHFRPAPHVAVRLVANTGNESFDKAVKRAWADHCFERDVLR